jgi:prefoldin subunit 5
MSNNYKFTPIDEFPDRLGDYNNYPDECEEISKTINNINKYIIKIEIFKKILNQIKSDDDDDYKMIINVIKDYLKKFPNIKIEYI